MTTADTIFTFGAVVAFLALFYGPWQAFCDDVSRQIAFEERAAIFDLAMAGRLSFNSGEYREIRDSLNRHIRFCHYLTWTRLVFFACSAAFHDRDRDAPSFYGAISRIADNEVRTEVRNHMRSALRVAIVMMLLRSLFCVLLFPVFVLIAVLIYLFERAHKKAAQFARYIADIIQSESECF